MSCRVERNVPALEGLSLSDIFQVPFVEESDDASAPVRWLEEKNRAGRVLDDLYDEFSGSSEVSEFEYNFLPEHKDITIIAPFIDMLISFLPLERHTRITAVESLLTPSQEMKAKSSAKKHAQAELEHREAVRVACHELVGEIKRDLVALSNTGSSPWADTIASGLATAIVENNILSKIEDGDGV